MTHKCPMCHSKVAEDAEICEKCGFNLTGKEEIKKEPKKVGEDEPQKLEEEKPKEHHKRHRVSHVEEHISERYQYEPKKNLFSNKMFIIGVIAVIGILGTVGAIFFAVKMDFIQVEPLEKFLGDFGKSSKDITPPPAPLENNTTDEANDTTEPEINDTPIIPVIPEDPPEKKVADYISKNKPTGFTNIENRIIEINFEGNKSILRFRVSTANPAQESLYLLGVQFLVFPNVNIANATGYNADGQIIQNPDSRTQDTRARYWKKYHTKSDWFPNLELEPECKVDADCEDKNACTNDKCLSSGFCSNARIVTNECPGIV